LSSSPKAGSVDVGPGSPARYNGRNGRPDDTALRILDALRRGPVADTGVLVGSSGLFGFETQVPALTEDIDIAVPEATVADPTFSDAGAQGYVPMRQQVEIGLKRLGDLLERLDA